MTGDASKTSGTSARWSTARRASFWSLWALADAVGIESRTIAAAQSSGMIFFIGGVLPVEVSAVSSGDIVPIAPTL